MKRTPVAIPLLALLLLLGAAAGPASANIIGLFGDSEGRTCAADFLPHETTRIHVLGLVSTVEWVAGVSFRIDGVDPEAGVVEIACEWNTEHSSGDPFSGGGIFLAFSPPLVPSGDGIVHLGTIDVTSLAAGWPAPDSYWCVVTPGGNPVHYLPPSLVFVDETFAAQDADGWCFKANCGLDCSCLAIPTAATSWGSLKSLY